GSHRATDGNSRGDRSPLAACGCATSLTPCFDGTSDGSILTCVPSLEPCDRGSFRVLTYRSQLHPEPPTGLTRSRVQVMQQRSACDAVLIGSGTPHSSAEGGK